MKKLLALILAATMTFTMVACSSADLDEIDAALDVVNEELDAAIAEEEPATVSDAEAAQATIDNAEALESATADQETVKFEVVSKGFQSTYWQAVYTGALAKLAELNAEAGYEKYIMNFVGPDSESDIASQVTMFGSAATSNPDAMGLAALDTSALIDTIGTVQAAGIPIIGFDSGVPDAPEGAVYANAATDNYAAGALAAANMLPAIESALGAGQVRIGVVNQDATAESIIYRGLGFIDEMIVELDAAGYTVAVEGNDKYVSDCIGGTADSASADVIIDVAVPSQTTVELCAVEAQALLNKADTIAIFGSNQVSAEGIVTANETLMVLSSDVNTGIIAVGFDSGTVLKAAVSAGTMYGAVTQAPVSIGYILVELMAASAAGEEVGDTDTGCAFYTAENIASQEIAQNLYD